MRNRQKTSRFNIHNIISCIPESQGAHANTHTLSLTLTVQRHIRRHIPAKPNGKLLSFSSLLDHCVWVCVCECVCKAIICTCSEHFPAPAPPVHPVSGNLSLTPRMVISTFSHSHCTLTDTQTLDRQLFSSFAYYPHFVRPAHWTIFFCCVYCPLLIS